MVNFGNAVTKVSYKKLRTITPNAKDVERFLYNVALTSTKPYGGLPSLMAEDAMYAMGAKAPKFNLKAFLDKTVTKNWGKILTEGLKNAIKF